MKTNKYRWELTKKLFGGKVIAIKPTMRCNLKCPYCAVNMAKGRAPLYSQKRYSFWIDVINREKPKLVVISGGEPTLYPHLHKIVNYCIKKRILVQLVTNLTTTYELSKITPSWRVILLSTYHPAAGLKNFLENYETLKNRFFITVRELRPKGSDMKPRFITWAKVKQIYTEQSDDYMIIYAPDGTKYHSCRELDEAGA